MVAGSEWIRASIGAPIIIQDQVVGLIAIDSSAPGRFDANDMARVELFARYAALAVSNAYQSDVLAQLVYARTAELEQAKAALEDQEALLRSAQRIAHVGSWVSDPAMQQSTWSEELFRISGFDPVPVSYTHLDVYKRQAFRRPRSAIRRSSRRARLRNPSSPTFSPA